MSTPEPPPQPTTPALSEPRRDAVEAVTWQVRVAAAWTWRVLIILVGIYVFARIFSRIELVAFSFVLALFFTAVLHPVEKRLRAFLPGPKSLPAALALLLGVAALGGIGWFVTWQISSHSSQLGDQLTEFVDKTRHWLKTGPLHLKSADLDKISDQITKAIKDHQSELISGAIATVRTVVEALGALLLILLSTFFLLRDGEEVWSWVLRLFPKRAQQRVDVAGRVGWKTFGGYMRGQLIIALFHGVSVTILLLILNVPLAAALGVLIFLGSFIPLLGLTITGSLAVAITLLEHGVTGALVVGISIIVLFQLEAHLLQPVIMSRSVELHPLAIALVVLTGTILAGIPGALISVPLAAFLNTTVRALRAPLPEDAPPQQQEEVVEDEVEAESGPPPKRPEKA
ncbi:MAG TPA: AI-2E family transporter [Jatrophihabitantaceae bacterium]|nr:AI-2E family transporter [Jatrophihabitantaceae bacterium]